MSARAKTAVLFVLFLGAGLIALTVVGGTIYEQVQRARDRELYPQIGRSVDLGGRMVNIDCAGSRQPAVILDRGSDWAYLDPRTIFQNGAPRPGYSWVRIQRELAKFTTACWYDRPGSGWSDLGPYPRDSASQAHDLQAVLQAAGIPPPYVLVAEASAALDARVFTGFYPASVAGLVMVNGVHPDLFSSIDSGGKARVRELLSRSQFIAHSQTVEAEVFNRTGFFRFASASANRQAAVPPSGISSSEWATIWHLTQGPKAKGALIQDIASWEQSSAQARAAGNLGDRPLFVISSEDANVSSKFRSVQTDLQADLARLSTRGKLVVVGESGDDLVYEHPEEIIDAARQVVEDLRQQVGRPR